VTDLIICAIAWGGYFGIFLLMAAENVVPPIPSEVIMGLGGMAVARGHMDLWPLVLIGSLGTTLGNYFWYWVGRTFGYRGLKPFIDRHGRWLTLDWKDVQRIVQFFRRRGHWVVFVFRFLPAFRTMVSLPAGMTAMPRAKFFAWTFAGSVIWNYVLAQAGIILGTRFQELDRYVGPVAVATTVLIVAVYAYRVITWKPHNARG
jgi:membrane protein DedA with SNARE-associated domain